jgi:GNAT superfamily N-acetyltransferase
MPHEFEEPLRITPATPDDVPTILNLITALADYEQLTDEVIADEAAIERTLFGDKPVAEALIARVGEATVGFAVFFHNFSTFLGRPGLYLEDLFVLPEYRGSGYGRALLAHLARIAVERGCGRMEWSVLNWNTSAIGFYESLGAKAMDEWTVYRLTGDALTRAAASTTGQR